MEQLTPKLSDLFTSIFLVVCLKTGVKITLGPIRAEHDGKETPTKLRGSAIKGYLHVFLKNRSSRIVLINIEISTV